MLAYSLSHMYSCRDTFLCTVKSTIPKHFMHFTTQPINNASFNLFSTLLNSWIMSHFNEALIFCVFLYLHPLLAVAGLYVGIHTIYTLGVWVHRLLKALTNMHYDAVYINYGIFLWLNLYVMMMCVCAKHAYKPVQWWCGIWWDVVYWNCGRWHMNGFDRPRNSHHNRK